ncbi:MAG TPA: hypothetical protein PKW98_13015 [Candidatus Wallbacteria bacterium]|nr:hypothetical protein [Candidatus Wallbacteria bacterium]
MVKNSIKIPAGSFRISIEELRKQLKGGNVNVGKEGVTMSKAGAIKVPEGTFHTNGIMDGVGNLLGLGEDVIARAKAKFAAGRGQRFSQRVQEAFSEPAARAVVNDNTEAAGQWYEKDAERFDIEVKEMENRGFRLIDLYDGRVGFEKIDEAVSIKITVICDWQYPLKPPAVYLEGGENVSAGIKKNADGSLALFTKYMPWKSDMAVCTVIEYFEEKLELLKELKSGAGKLQEEVQAAPPAGPAFEKEN